MARRSLYLLANLMKLTIITFSICTLILSLGCTAGTDVPSTADVIESTATSEKAEDGSGTVSTGESAPVVSSADIGDTADQTAKMEAAKKVAMPELPDAALTIGSKAPSLDIEHWISNGNRAFAEVTDFESDQVYVVEFWATWCGPCVRSMPHLVELQEKFKDSVQVVSVSNEDLDTVNAFLERPYT